MFRKQIDILAIGDTTTDAFIRLEKADVHCNINTEDCEICMPFGEKIPYEYVKEIKGAGNAANAAVAAARLGLRSALISDLGDDRNGRDCSAELQKNAVITSFIKVHKDRPTNYHFILWYDQDRTILTKHTEYDYRLPDAMLSSRPSSFAPAHSLPPKWVYLTSIASNTFPYHMQIADYLDAHPEVRLAFQPGTFQIHLGFQELKRLCARTDVFIVNKKEAEEMLGAELHNVDNLHASDLHTSDLRAGDPQGIKAMMEKIAAHGPKMVIITDNTAGAYFFDGEHHYHMPMYPDPRPAFERTGCGDAFASTFVSAMAMGKAPLEALVWAPVNPMSVAQFIGSQEGLMERDQIEWWLERAPEEYKPREI